MKMEAETGVNTDPKPRNKLLEGGRSKEGQSSEGI